MQRKIREGKSFMNKEESTFKLTPYGEKVSKALQEKRKAREELEAQGIDVTEEPWYHRFLTSTYAK